MFCKKTLSIGALLMASTGSIQADVLGELDGLCDDFEATGHSDIAAIGHVRVYRSPFDFEGPRLVGCMKNTGGTPLSSVSLVFDKVQTRGGGGGTISLFFEALDPNRVGRFSTTPFRDDAKSLKDSGTTGIKLRGLKTRIDNVTFASHDFAERIEMAYPLMDRPESELQQTCAVLESLDQGAGVMLSELRMIETVAGEVKVAGCIANGTDATLADNHRNKVDIGYKTEAAGDDPAARQGGGFGGLRLAGPLEPGRADVFLTDFELEEGFDRVVIQFYGDFERDDGYYETRPVGPEFSVGR